MVLQYLQKYIGKTIGFDKIVFGNVNSQMFYQLFLSNKTNGFSNIVFGNVVKPMVLTHCVWKCCKTDDSSNTIFGNVVKPMVSATLCLQKLLN